jgi:tetratricopeptide (TPR) repeat protein
MGPQKHLVLPLLVPLVSFVLSSTIVSAAGQDELSRALEEARSSGGHVLVALIDEDGSPAAVEALRDPSSSSKLEPCARVIVSAARRPLLAARFGATELPLLVLLDSSGREVGRAGGQGSPAALLQTLRALGEVAAGLESSRRKLDENPADREALYALGAYHWSRGEAYRAVRYLGRLLELPAAPEHSELLARARERMTEHLIRSGSFQEAEEELKRVDPKSVPAEHGDWIALQLALLLRRNERIEEAIGVLSDRLESGFESALSARILFTRAYLERERGQRLKAMESFGALAERFPHTLYGRRAEHYLAEREVRSE